MAELRNLLESFDNMVKENDDVILAGDQFDIELSENFIIETGVVGFAEDGIVVQGDDAMFEFLEFNNVLVEDIELLVEGEERQELRDAFKDMMSDWLATVEPGRYSSEEELKDAMVDYADGLSLSDLGKSAKK